MTIFEIVSILVAVTGLSFAIYEGRLNRQYHRISLKPKLIIRKHLGGSRGKLGISVTNEGAGVVLIKRCEIRIKGKNMSEKGDNGWDEAIEALRLSKDKDEIRYNVIAPGGAIAISKWEWLLYTDVTNVDFREKLNDAIDKSQIEIKITYESVFEEKDEVYFLTGKLLNAEDLH